MKPMFFIAIIFFVGCSTTQSFVEQDKIALAKTITVNAGYGITIKESATQSLSNNPKWAAALDTIGWNVWTKQQAYSKPQVDLLINQNIATLNKRIDSINVGGGSVDAYPKIISDTKYEWQVNLQKDARRFFSAVGSIKYDTITGQISYTQPANVSAFANDKKYGVAIQSVSITGTDTKTFQITFADGTKSTPVTFTDMQGAGGGITTKQLSDY